MPQKWVLPVKHNQFSLKNKIKKNTKICTGEMFFHFPEVKNFTKKDLPVSLTAENKILRRLPQTHRREISPNLHCLYHTFPQILTNKGLSTQLFQNNFKLKLRTINQQSVKLQQKSQEYTMENGQSLQPMALRKTGQPRRKNKTGPLSYHKQNGLKT